MSDEITDSAREHEAEEKVQEKVEINETIPSEKPFEEQLDAAVDQSVEQFYKDLLVKADETIRLQALQLADIQSQQLEFRDEIAVRCFVPFVDKFSSYGDAAGEAYRAADAFLRSREGVNITEGPEEEKE